MLLDAGADVNALTTDGLAPIHWAVARRDSVMIKELLSRGANPSLPDPNKSHPLHEAIYKGMPEIAFTLIRAGADVNARHMAGWTPIVGAAR